MTNQTQDKALALLERIRAKRLAAMQAQEAEANQATTEVSSEASTDNLPTTQAEIPVEVASQAPEEMVWNEAQTKFIQLGADLTSLSNRRMILTGAAGTGKTTAVKGLVQTFLVMHRMGGFPRLAWGTKRLEADSMGIVAISYTNKAVENVRRVMPKELKPHCLTIHKLLEFEPTFYEVWDPMGGPDKQGAMKNTMRFEPKRNKMNKLPDGLKVILIDEASMVPTAERDADGNATALFEQLEDALPHGCKIIFIGDIQQLPPVFGDSILGHSLLKVPTVELTEVYRQALDSPIISNAWRVLKGHAGFFNSRATPDAANPKRIVVPSFAKITEESKGKLTILPWQKKFTPHQATVAATTFVTKLAANGGYLPDEDIILCPFNVNFGTVELNKHLAQWFGAQREAVVYEVIAGVNKNYYAVGDKVMYQKDEFKITEINHNAMYMGKPAQAASKNLDRWGHYQAGGPTSHETEEAALLETDIDSYLEAMSTNDNGEDRFNHASHTITIQNIIDPCLTYTLGTTGEIASLDLGYVITVHKSQGSEWRRVIILFHHTHSVMLFRELFYTALTRAKEEVLIICEPNSLEKCVNSPRIKGVSLQEKAEYFDKRRETKQKFKQLKLE